MHLHILVKYYHHHLPRLLHAATEGDDDGNTLRVYGDAINDDEFRKRLSVEEFKQLMEPTTTETVLDDEALKRGEEILIEVTTQTCLSSYFN